jgi:hypothetical protein
MREVQEAAGRNDGRQEGSGDDGFLFHGGPAHD